MPAVITFFYRNYELPWTVDPEERDRFRKIWRTALGIVLLFSIAMPYLPVPERPFDVPPPIPPRIAQLVLDRAPPPPPPPPPVQVEPKPRPDQKAPQRKPTWSRKPARKRRRPGCCRSWTSSRTCATSSTSRRTT
jgi:hypothetical protein